jgi:hypothetical protein
VLITFTGHKSLLPTSSELSFHVCRHYGCVRNTVIFALRCMHLICCTDVSLGQPVLTAGRFGAWKVTAVISLSMHRKDGVLFKCALDLRCVAGLSDLMRQLPAVYVYLHTHQQQWLRIRTQLLVCGGVVCCVQL